MAVVDSGIRFGGDCHLSIHVLVSWNGSEMGRKKGDG